MSHKANDNSNTTSDRQGDVTGREVSGGETSEATIVKLQYDRRAIERATWKM